ncbi:hypothetical protein [Bradyrhizobium sp. 145]|uniref:hypothetical protein n=1 Tax=Bradyrhizobium sp. 145 TaxID=2782621 RepID=UPI001FFA4CB1|nr:hypothetical protein [Bradyrhizobium sp. 145]MCK1684408.1 hypothetical protein [Bradyrhizobium sp. 145]
MVAKKLIHPMSFAGAFTEISEPAVPARGIRFVFDLRPAACLNNDRYCRVGDIAIEKRRELASCPSAQSLHTTRAWERRREFSGSRFVLERAHFEFGKVRCDLTFLLGLLIQRISNQSSASHAVSNRTSSCIVF